MKIENQEVKKFVKVEYEQYELQACVHLRLVSFHVTTHILIKC